MIQLLIMLFCSQIDAPPTLEERYLHLSVARMHIGDTDRFIDGDVEKDFPVVRFLEMADYLQELPENKRIQWLREASRTGQLGEAAVYLSRMLIESSSDENLRPIWSGLTDRASYDQNKILPDAPLEIFDGVPFFVGVSGHFSGTPEYPEQYVEYLLKNGKWRQHRFAAMTQAEISRVAENYLRSLEASEYTLSAKFKNDIREQASIPLRRGNRP